MKSFKSRRNDYSGVGMLESGVFERLVAGILNVAQSVIFKCRIVIKPTEILHTDIAEDATGLQLNVRAVFVDLVLTSMVS